MRQKKDTIRAANMNTMVPATPNTGPNTRHDLVLESHQGARDAHDAQHHTDGYSEHPVQPIQNLPDHGLHYIM